MTLPLPLPEAGAAAQVPPAVAGCEGPSFTATVRWLATALVLAIVVQATRSATVLASTGLTFEGQGLAIAAVAVVFASYWAILRSRTSIDGERIRQTWLWPKEVAIADIAQLKLIRVRGLDWLITPRLVVRARGQGLVTFHAADPRVIEAFAALAYGRS
jgi:hypothetical protein